MSVLSKIRTESLSFGAWRCQIIGADGTVRLSVPFPERDYDRPEQAETDARNWCAWHAGAFAHFPNGKSPLEPGESVRLQYRAPGINLGSFRYPANYAIDIAT